MEFNRNYIYLIVFSVGMFTLGGLLNGERIKRKLDREKLKELETNQKSILFRVDSLYATAIEQEKAVLKKIDSTYLVIEDLYKKKSITRKQLNQTKKTIANQREGIANRVQELKRLERKFIFKKNTDN